MPCRFSLHTPNNLSLIPRSFLESRRTGLCHVVFLSTPRIICHLFLVPFLSQGGQACAMSFFSTHPNNLSLIPRSFLESRRTGLCHVVFLYTPRIICHLLLVHSSSQGRDLCHVVFFTHIKQESFFPSVKGTIPCCCIYTIYHHTVPIPLESALM